MLDFGNARSRSHDVGGIAMRTHRRHALSVCVYCVQDVIASTDVFHPTGGGAAAMAADMGVPFLGRIPLDAALSRAGEEGRSAFAEGNISGTTLPLAAGHHDGVSSSIVQNGNGHAMNGSRRKVRVDTGSLSSLREIIDKVITAAEGPAAA